MKKLVLIDGNSIINRAFYGIMGSKALMSADGMYTNGIYGFLSIYFKIIDDIKPEYVAVAFDLKAPTKRHLMYKEYKGTRKGMPEELAQQMPVLKDVLKAMNITIIEKEGYEADDILGTLAKFGKAQGLDVTILTGDRDSFQLIEDNITVRIPRTKMGTTEEEDYTPEKIRLEYGLEPIKLIEVKGLMGDASDNIPGVPGIGEKTALSLIQEYGSIENLYKKIENNEDDLKGKTREKIAENKELAELSRTLGTIDIHVPLDANLENLERKEWNLDEVFEIFKKLRFNRYIERFSLGGTNKQDFSFETEELHTEDEIKNIINSINKNNRMFYYLDTEGTKFKDIYIYNESNNKVSYIILDGLTDKFKDVFENENILKCSNNLKRDICLLTKSGIEPKNMMYDVHIAGYILNATSGKYSLEDLSNDFLGYDIYNFAGEDEASEKQINLFDAPQVDKPTKKKFAYVYVIRKLYDVFNEKLKEIEATDLFNNIEMPLTEVLADMENTGVYVNKDELKKFGDELEVQIEKLKKEIYELCGEEFNINSPKQLGEILFEKLQLPVKKKTKSGYSTDGDVLEKLKREHPAISRILEYRQLSKLKSTFVDAMIPYINPQTERIHSHFHQTVTATGRISSTDPNLQNIPTRMELGQKLRQVFEAQNENTIFLDADYSQIELRVLAHIANDENMIEAFKEGEDIHKQAASKVFNVPLEEVTKQMRSNAKAVNFGIVYGISDYGLSEQLGISVKQARQYIEQYLEKYKGIKEFMTNINEEVKQKGYAQTLFNRRRYVPEINSSNYMIRQFGSRVAMNTPIQGTAADIIKIAMIRVYNELKMKKLKSKLVLQIHDELLVETYIDEKEQVKQILKDCMENVINLKVPLVTEIGEGKNWYEAK